MEAREYKVTPRIGEALSYNVQSLSTGVDHVVDLRLNPTHMCSCMHFEKCVAGNIKKGLPEYYRNHDPKGHQKNDTICSHIEAALWHWAINSVKDISHEIRKKEINNET